VEAARESDEGAVVANIGGPPVPMADVVRAIEAAAPDVAGGITFDDVPLPFPEEFAARARPSRLTPLGDGVQETIEHFRARAPV
jgi:hypothetical protein